ncbi:MAG: head-tail connector protein, partial [Phyllobacterium sp.]
PTTLDHGYPVRIRYWAGYGRRDTEDAEEWINAVPPPIKVAVLLYVGAWYENREETAIGVSVAGLPDNVSAEALLQTYKVYR